MHDRYPHHIIERHNCVYVIDSIWGDVWYGIKQLIKHTIRLPYYIFRKFFRLLGIEI